MKAEEIPEEWVEAGARALELADERLYYEGFSRSRSTEEKCRIRTAAALAAVIPQVRAAALREAAEALFYNEDTDHARPGYFLLVGLAERTEET